MPATELIAVSIPQNHPSGTRRRAGYEFTTTPSVAEVTPEEKAAIKADQYIIVHRRQSLAWFTAFKIEHSEKNQTKYAKSDPENWQETANVARRIDQQASLPPAKKKTAQKGKESQGGNLKTSKESTGKVNHFSSKADVIAALTEEKKLVAGKDFDPDASRNALLAIYNS